MAILTGRTMFLSLDSETVLKLTGLNLAGTAQELTAAVTNETTGLFPESAVSGLQATITANGVTSQAVIDKLWALKFAGAAIAYVVKRENATGKTQWAGNCVVTAVNETIGAATEQTFSVTVKLSGAPTVSPSLALAGASVAADGTIMLTPTAQSASYSGSDFVASGGSAPYTYAACGPDGTGSSQPPAGISMNSSGVISGSVLAGEIDGYHYWYVKVTDNNSVVKHFRVGMQVS